MRARYKACIVSLLLPGALLAQDIGLLRTAPSPAGSRGTASVYGGAEGGGYHPAFAPASLWKAGAQAQGTLHRATTSWTGAFSFEQVEGKDQFTSMFLEPGYFPVDVLEFTPGAKTRQTYRMSGGFATDVAEEFAAGIKASYQAANYSKRKDIRHTTYGMTLQVEPTVAFHGGEVGLSLAYIFRKRTESIDAEQVGSATDQSYYAFLDKGMRYGTYQVWDGDGLHLDEAGVGVFPVREYAHGFAYVMDAPLVAGRMEMLWKRGAVGEKGFDWFKYPGLRLFASMERRWKSGHSLGLSMELQQDQLREAVLEKVSEGGITTPRIHGYNAVSDRKWASMDLTYAYRIPGGPLKRLQAILHGGIWAEQSYLMYPYEDRTDRYNGMLTLLAAFSFGPMDLNLRLNGGAGSWKDRGLQGGTDEVLSKPFRLEADWLRKMEYFSTTKAGAGLTLTWHLKAVRGLFLQAEGSWLHGFGIVLLPGADRESLTLKVGYGF